MLVSFQAHLLTQLTIVHLLLRICFLTFSHSQFTPANPSAPTMEECGPRLIPLAPCASFVQGQSLAPTELCCSNLIQVYNQQRGCLCLFLNGGALTSLPINTTLALQLPSLCSPQINPAACSSSGGSTTPGSSLSQASFRNTPNGATVGGPAVTMAPRPSTVRFGLGKSSAYRLAGCRWGIAVALICLLL